MCLEAGAPIALSSDAHVPEHLGWEYEPTVAWLAAQGVRELCVFERRERRSEPLG
jgi:histidinol-phosphatase (PHP family)